MLFLFREVLGLFECRGLGFNSGPTSNNGSFSLDNSWSPVGGYRLFHELGVGLPENCSTDFFSGIGVNRGTRTFDIKTPFLQLIGQHLTVHTSFFGQLIYPHPAHSLLPNPSHQRPLLRSQQPYTRTVPSQELL